MEVAATTTNNIWTVTAIPAMRAACQRCTHAHHVERGLGRCSDVASVLRFPKQSRWDKQKVIDGQALQSASRARVIDRRSCLRPVTPLRCARSVGGDALGSLLDFRAGLGSLPGSGEVLARGARTYDI
ncbi:hypothetical protein NDU88_008748 [Pleurodeles waltl]|uniref:Uncharacterized protein n=1 Tax=Pleurodeles waltl TaxID=8319 RepID=A0AAV7NWY3_PLEWA|nr:hypothetical protein NDU88_008748 [Pleurodeles waltl]